MAEKRSELAHNAAVDHIARECGEANSASQTTGG
jgi:hypothetical protein